MDENGRMGPIPCVIVSFMHESRSDIRGSKGLMSFTWHFLLKDAEQNKTYDSIIWVELPANQGIVHGVQRRKTS